MNVLLEMWAQKYFLGHHMTSYLAVHNTNLGALSPTLLLMICRSLLQPQVSSRPELLPHIPSQQQWPITPHSRIRPQGRRLHSQAISLKYPGQQQS